MVEREAVEVLGPFLFAALGEGVGLASLPARADRAPRDVWISWRPLEAPAELAIARWAVAAGAAVLVEPGEALHPELVAWARPTILCGSFEELGRLAGELAALAPRFFRSQWFRQRGGRLRLLVVEGEPAGNDLARLGERWRRVSPHFAPRVERFSIDSLV